MKAALFLALLPLPALLAAEPPAVTLIQTRIGKPLGEDVTFDIKPMGHQPGVTFSFLVRGENLVSFKDDSVHITDFTLADGRQWARTRGGKPNWEQESFPKVAESGQLGTFGVSFPGDLHGQIDRATLTGTVTAITAAESDEKTLTLTAGDPEKKDLGPFKVTAGSGGGGLFGGGGEDSTTVRLTGRHQAIIQVTLLDGDTPLESNGSSWSGDTKSYHFPKAKGADLKVTLRYWTDLQELTIPFKIAPAGK